MLAGHARHVSDASLGSLMSMRRALEWRAPQD